MSHTTRSSNARRGGHHHGNKAVEKQNPKLVQLKEVFPSWSDDDLVSVLADVNYEVETAVTRISEGRAEQWGAVSHKKDKKPSQAPTNARTASFSGDRESVGFRGQRGGRGGARGARGGARGVGRGGHREQNGRTPAAQTTGAWDTGADATEATATSTADWGTVNGESADDAGAQASASDASKVDAPKVVQDASTKPHTNGVQAEGPGESTPAGTGQASFAAKPAPKVKSWADIAKPQAKPKPAPPPAPVVAASPPVQEPVAAPPEPEQQPEPEPTGWEEPTTVEPPTWDDEPEQQQEVSDDWPSAEPAEVEPEQVSAKPSPAPEPQILQEPEPIPVSAPTAIPASVRQKIDSAVTPPNKPSTPVSYARSLSSRAGNRFKAAEQAVTMPNVSVESLGMQFGSFGVADDEPSESSAPEPPLESPVQPQEPIRESPAVVHAPLEQEPAAPSPIVAAQAPITSSQSPFQQTLPQTQTPQLSSLHRTPTLIPNQPAPSAISSQTATSTTVSTPLTSFSTVQTATSQSSVSPYHQHETQQPASHTPQTHTPAQSQVPQQTQSQLHQQFSHFPSHLDQHASQPSPSHVQQVQQAQVQQQTQPQQQQQQQQPQPPTTSLQQGLGSHGSYFRQPEQSYNQSQTPPTGQSQDGAYGSFGPLSQQLGYQSGNSHLSNFSDQFGYNDQGRGYYDSYGQQSSFGRNNLSHDDLSKNLPGAQQQQSQVSSALPQTNSQTGQQQNTQQPQNAAQPQAPGQPQQGYAPMPYYYTPPHFQAAGQYYGSPYSQAYGGLNQYGGRFQPQQPLYTPSNPTSASPANAKGPSGPQSLPYGQSMYGQGHASSYDDAYGHHGQLGQTHSVSGMPGNEYGKQLYGAQGIQSFIQANSPNAALGQRGVAGATGVAGAAASPDTTYKPYGQGVSSAKDIGGAPGVGGGIVSAQGALGQSVRPGGVQAPAHSQGLYGSAYGAAGRFSGTPNVNGPPAQQGAQQTQGYAQGGAADYGFNYPRTQNGQYWGNA